MAGSDTGGRGHRFGFSYVLSKNVVPSLTYFLDRFAGRNNNADYSRLQADVVVKFGRRGGARSRKCNHTLTES